MPQKSPGWFIVSIGPLNFFAVRQCARVAPGNDSKNINMKQFTDEQRIEFLKEAALRLDNKFGRLMCATLSKIIFDDHWHFRHAYNLFPELKKYKPSIPYSNTRWFDPDDSDSRITILLSVIYEIENK